MRIYPDYHHYNRTYCLDAWWEPVWFLALLEAGASVKEAATTVNVYRWHEFPDHWLEYGRSHLTQAPTSRCHNCRYYDQERRRPKNWRHCAWRPPVLDPRMYACSYWAPAARKGPG